VRLCVTVENENHVPAKLTVPLDGGNIREEILLKPYRSGTIVLMFDDPLRVLGAGRTPPKYCSVNLFTSDKKGNPVTSAKFTMNGEQLAEAGSGAYSSKRFPFSLGLKKEVLYKVENGAAISLEVKPIEGAPTIDFETKPTSISAVRGTASTTMYCSLRATPGSGNLSYLFRVLDRNLKPCKGIEMFMNLQGGWRSIGMTDPDGILQYKVNNVNAFWALNPKVRLDLGTEDCSEGFSREVKLTRSTSEQFDINLDDIRPD